MGVDVAVILPARWASERLPAKMLADLGGAPLIVRTWQRASLARGVARVLVATDDARIEAAVRAAGGEAVRTPVDCASGSDRCAKAAAAIGWTGIVVNVQGDEPLLDPGCIEAVLTAFDDPRVSMATLARPLRDGERDNPAVVKVVRDLRGDALCFSRAPLGHPREPGGPVEARAHVGVYAFTAAFLQTFQGLSVTPLEQCERLEQLRVLEHGCKIRVIDVAAHEPGVDTEADLQRVRRHFLYEGAPT